MMSALQGFYAGSVEGCTEWLQDFIDAGARHLVVRFGSFDALGQMKRAAGPLLSALRG